MFGSEILDVAIGLIFLFLLLSLVCSSIKEALETVLKFRARDLHRGITEMLRDGKDAKIVADLYSHPLVSGLFKGDYNGLKLGNLPSYIPPGIFSTALLDLLNPASKVPQIDALAQPGTLGPAAQLRSAVMQVPNEAIRRALLPLIDAAGGDLEQVRRNIEGWYNGAMDRVSGWYKRRTQQIIALVGLLLAGFMNVDAIAITRYLNTDQTSRSVIVARAEALQGTKPDPNVDLADPIGYLQHQGGIPVGWAVKPEPGQNKVDFDHDWRRLPDTPQGWLMKIAGILFTTFAVSLGAPFWFDVLNKFMVVRSTVKPQEKSRDEPSKA